MIFNAHYGLSGQHAVLSASKPYWLNYDPDKFEDYIRSMEAAKLGSELHAFAAHAIKLKQRLRTSKKTVNLYVNDAIGYRMEPEQTLYFSPNCFGTADAISFRHDVLRISDLKTGVSKPNVKQLLVYAAIFCLEYAESPAHIDIELRFYQNDEIALFKADSADVLAIMDKIRVADKRINELREEGLI